MLVGVVLVLPLILGYTFVVYRTFRGKVRPGEGYH
jgi:cytochrome d ubiquinol oxidase subunit II